MKRPVAEDQPPVINSRARGNAAVFEFGAIQAYRKTIRAAESTAVTIHITTTLAGNIDTTEKKPAPAAVGTAIAAGPGSTIIAPQDPPENIDGSTPPEVHFHYPEEWWSDAQE